MPLFVFVILMALIRQMASMLKRPPTRTPRTLCEDCAFVHMQYGVSARNAVFCTFGGGLREVKLKVLYCTDYRNRNQAPRLVQIGFSPDFRTAEAKVS